MALNLAKPIVPVLYQPCDIPRQLQNIQYLDFTSTNDTDARRDALAAALRSRPQDGEPRRHRPDGLVGRDLRNRGDFLDEARSEVAERLAQSLHVGMLNVLKEKQPEQVTRQWDPEVKIRDQQRTPLGPDTGIVQIFDDDAVGGKLLILGAPGSGKTTALLELDRELIMRAEQDVAEPMPVLCNLSSWREDGQGLAVWLVDHLKVKYGVRKDLGNAWLNDRLLVPLLDGLDEVTPEHQEACVQAINRFQQDFRPQHIVVCCRLAEYQNYRTKLQLNGAVRLLPLADDQIRQYLLRAESPALWQGISGDHEMLELARSPLLLRMTTVAYEETSPEEWQRLASASERQAHLFDVYIRRVLSDDTTAQQFSKAQTIEWLGWLAKTMKEHGEAELLIEHLQPTWLPSATQRRVYGLAVFVSAAVVFVLVTSVGGWLFELVPRGAVGFEYLNVAAKTWGLTAWRRHDLLSIIVIGLAAGLIVALRKTIQPIETLVWSWTKGWHGMTSGLRRMSLVGLNQMAYVGLVAGLLAGVGMLWSIWAAEKGSPELARFSVAGYIEAAVAVLSLVVAILLTLRPSAWLVGRADTSARGSAADAIVSGLALCAGASPNMGLVLGGSAGLSFGLIVRFSGASNLLSAARFADALVIGLISGFGAGAIAWATQSVRSGLIDYVAVWMLGGVGVAATAALFVGVAGGFRNPRAAAVHPANGLGRRGMESLGIGVIIATVSGLMTNVARHTGGLPLVRGIALMSARLGAGWISSLLWALLVATLAGLLGMVMGAFLGALFGVLHGLTGPDIERRTVPNQGIRQSAANVRLFALAGILIVGVPYGLMNLIVAAAWTRVAPDALDWVHFALGPTVLFGLMGGLVPGAAVIQHFTLRFVLWCFGLAPWRTIRFLNYATERMLLQRVGGRYRFIHDLLREHFASMQPAPGVVPD